MPALLLSTHDLRRARPGVRIRDRRRRPSALGRPAVPAARRPRSRQRGAGLRRRGLRARPRHLHAPPLPDEATVAAACRAGSGPQLRLFAFVGDIAKEGGIDGPRALLTNPASAQVLLNVVFFVPLGMLVRHLALRGRLVAGLIGGTVVGFAVSLLIEVTQLTGDWFLYPCAYRLFDVDDLLANTVGALLGALLSPSSSSSPAGPRARCRSWRARSRSAAARSACSATRSP